MNNSKEESRIDEWISIIQMYLDAIGSKSRRKILELCFYEPKTISQLTRLLNSSNKVTWNNVKLLEATGLIVLDKRKNDRYHPVYVKSEILPKDLADVLKLFSGDLPKMLKLKRRTI